MTADGDRQRHRGRTDAQRGRPAGDEERQTVDQAWLRDVCRGADDLLRRACTPRQAAAADTPAPRIVLPLKGGEPRLGRQEARLAFIAALLENDPSADWGLAVESPTRLSYRFAERGGAPKAQRGLFDLALFGRDRSAPPPLTVTFRSGGRSGKSERDEGLVRDVARILAESPDALWFHVAQGITAPALQTLLRALDASISRLSSPFKLAQYTAVGKQTEPRAKTIAFHLSLLGGEAEVPASLHRVLEYVPGKPVAGFFVTEGETLDAALAAASAAGWNVERLPAA